MPSFPGPRRFVLGLALLLILGGAARLAHAPELLGEGGPHLIPTDSHYYLRFAQLQDGAFPALRRFDPLVNFPTGAHVLWPPLHTWLVAALQHLAPSPEVGTGWTGPVASALWLALLALLGRRWLGREGALWLVGALALVPLAVADGQLGNADHHVHEAPLVALTLLCSWRASGRGGLRAGLALGGCLALARLLTTSGFLLIPAAALAFPLAALLRRRAEVIDGPGAVARSAGEAASVWRAGVGALGIAGALQGLSALAWGVPGSLDYTQLGAFHPLWTATWLGGALALTGWIDREDSSRLHWRRVLPMAVLTLLCAGVLGPTVRSGVGDAARADAVLLAAAESRPLWGDPRGALSLWGAGWWLWAGALLAGLASLRTPQSMAAAPPGTPSGGTGACRSPAIAASDLQRALLIALPLLPLSLVQVRVARLGAGALAVSLAVGMPALRALLALHVRPIVSRCFWALSALTALLLLLPRGAVLPHEERNLRPTLRWLEAHTPAPGAAPAWSVLTPWTYGHLVTAWAGRATLATPFSQAPVHEEGNARALAILAEPDDARAYQKAREASVRYVLAAPYHGTVGPVETEHLGLAARLLEEAGLSSGGAAGSSAHFRLVHESREERNRPGGGPLARIFEVVPGAALTGITAPDAEVELRLSLRSERGTRSTYLRRARADHQGRWELRVAHPTAPDPHATVQAEAPYRLRCGEAWGALEVGLAQVREGGQVQVDCPATTGPRAQQSP